MRPAERVRPRCTADDGAALMETSIIAPFFLLVVFFLMEAGLVYRDYLATGDTVSDAVKFGAMQGGKLTPTGASADFTMMTAIRQGLANIPQSWVQRIVIYKANAASAGTPVAQVPAACKTGLSSTTYKCNVYSDTFTAFYRAQQGDSTYFSCVSGLPEPACGWPPTAASRPDGPKNANIAYVGVYVKVSRRMMTGLFGRTFTFEVAGIQRVEPGQLT